VSNKLGDRALVQKTLKHMQDDAEFAGLRDYDALAKLPPGERKLCHKLWANGPE
jgi:hypothetical protein